ncbi:zeta toxin family protein [Streptomyces hydrogenans]|uniref:zeta toxin family protein n=1 Tax=Streptomyces hydrogenans TaxID=1873719 RepID=UPI0027E0152E|nr:zeta toxin family protein [Streptomyces hydrogenans]
MSSVEAHGLTLEKAGERLREVAEQAKLKGIPAANPRRCGSTRPGEVYPGPHYRRAYCLLYRATEPDLGFRNALPAEENPSRLTPIDDRINGGPCSGGRAGDPPHRTWLGGGRSLRAAAADHDAWKRRQHRRRQPHRPVLILVGGYAGSGKTELARFFVQLTGWPLLDKDPLTPAARGAPAHRAQAATPTTGTLISIENRSDRWSTTA